MASQLDNSYGSYTNANAAIIPAFTAVVVTSATTNPPSVDLTANGGALVFGITQEDIAIGGIGRVKLRSGDGTVKLLTAAAVTAGTSYSLNAAGKAVAIGSSPNDVARVLCVSAAASGGVGEFQFI
jgi:Uncharacterized conserved protein (DUF2190)